MNRHDKLKKGLTLLAFIFLLVQCASAAQQFGGLMWQMEIAIIFVATAFSILTFARNDTPFIGIISAVFWFYVAIASNKLIIYLDDGTTITNMNFFHLTYLFGLIGVLFIVYSIYLYLVGAKKTISGLDNRDDSGPVNRRF